MKPKIRAVVPGYYLVCYNCETIMSVANAAVVPGYYLVCYNLLNLELMRIML